MKETSTYIFFIILFVTLNAISIGVQAQFKGTKLDMSLNEVQNIMGKASDITDDGTGIVSHAYDDKLDGMDVRVYFRFIENKLVENMILFEGPYSTKDYYFFYYDKINKLLADKYGEAEKQILKNDQPLSKYGDLDADSTYSKYFLLANNYIIYSTTWEVSDMKVHHLMAGMSDRIDQIITYKVSDYDWRKNEILKDQF